VDFTEDHRIGKEILQGVSDQYRKLRNTFRYMLGALDGFSEAERVAVEDMPELERYVLHLLADMDAKLRVAVNDFDFNTYVKLLTEFANNDLSAFFFDIRKDCLYCDAATDPKRMAYRTVLDILFHAMVRYAAPVLVFTSEEVWGTRFGADADSVHLLEWPEVDAGWRNHNVDEALADIQGLDFYGHHWFDVRKIRRDVTEAIEPLRREKIIGSSLEAEVEYFIVDEERQNALDALGMAEICIVSGFRWRDSSLVVLVSKTTNHKCGRCWRHLPEVTEDGALCCRCDSVINA
jgi:isoleucyl-tRNA synthetase